MSTSVSTTVSKPINVSKNVIQTHHLTSYGIHYIKLKNLNPKKTPTTTTPKQRIIFLHGWLQSAENCWLKTAQAICESLQHECLVLDFPGHGESYYPDEDPIWSLRPWEWHLLVRRILLEEGWVNNSNSTLSSCQDSQSSLPKLTLAGCSMGGMVSTIYHASWPVNRLLLLGVPGHEEGQYWPLSFGKRVFKALARNVSNLTQKQSKQCVGQQQQYNWEIDDGQRYWQGKRISVDELWKKSQSQQGNLKQVDNQQQQLQFNIKTLVNDTLVVSDSVAQAAASSISNSTVGTDPGHMYKNSDEAGCGQDVKDLKKQLDNESGSESGDSGQGSTSGGGSVAVTIDNSDININGTSDTKTTASTEMKRLQIITSHLVHNNNSNNNSTYQYLSQSLLNRAAKLAVGATTPCYRFDAKRIVPTLVPKERVNKNHNGPGESESIEIHPDHLTLVHGKYDNYHRLRLKWWSGGGKYERGEGESDNLSEEGEKIQPDWYMIRGIWGERMVVDNGNSLNSENNFKKKPSLSWLELEHRNHELTCAFIRSLHLERFPWFWSATE